jgi:hypothetical protein
MSAEGTRSSVITELQVALGNIDPTGPSILGDPSERAVSSAMLRGEGGYTYSAARSVPTPREVLEDVVDLHGRDRRDSDSGQGSSCNRNRHKSPDESSKAEPAVLPGRERGFRPMLIEWRLREAEGNLTSALRAIGVAAPEFRENAESGQNTESLNSAGWPSTNYVSHQRSKTRH